MSSNPFLGQIQALGFSFAPRGWAKCDGTLLAISQNSALFALLGTLYGGDGRTTFALPDLRSRSIVHIGTGTGLDTITQGERGGKISETLTLLKLPSHNHGVSANVSTGLGSEPTSTGIIASHETGFAEEPTAGDDLGGVSQISVGSNQAFNIRNPYLGIEYCIALQGIFPSRN
jgi:microcystin-dependent protein